MANKGTPWLPEQDLLMMRNINMTDRELAMLLGRTPLAVECHRAQLAVELKRADPEVTLEECCDRFRANVERVTRRLSTPAATEPRAKKFKVSKLPSGDSSDLVLISAAAELIRTSGGDMSKAWADSTLVPVMIKYHSGFEAYTATVKSSCCPSPPLSPLSPP
jgi:hypothetical protein